MRFSVTVFPFLVSEVRSVCVESMVDPEKKKSFVRISGKIPLILSIYEVNINQVLLLFN